MSPNQALWEKGDFTEIAASMRSAGEAFVATLDVTPSMHVLDLGAGDGTTAVPLARLGATVTAIDIARNLVAAGSKRASELGLTNLTYRLGDATDLQGVADASFDLSLSMFGAMFAPKPFEVAKELVRVTKPGERIVMCNWIPNEPTSYVSQTLKISSAFAAPPPEGFISPMLWGVEANIVERFEAAGIAADRITMERDTFPFALPDKTVRDLIDTFRTYYGPTMNAFENAQKDGREDELYKQLVEMAEHQNGGPGPGVHLGATFMRVTVRR